MTSNANIRGGIGRLLGIALAVHPLSIAALASYNAARYNSDMIRCFACRETALIWTGKRSRKLPSDIQASGLTQATYAEPSPRSGGFARSAGQSLGSLERGSGRAAQRSGSTINGGLCCRSGMQEDRAMSRLPIITRMRGAGESPDAAIEARRRRCAMCLAITACRRFELPRPAPCPRCWAQANRSRRHGGVGALGVSMRAGPFARIRPWSGALEAIDSEAGRRGLTRSAFLAQRARARNLKGCGQGSRRPALLRLRGLIRCKLRGDLARTRVCSSVLSRFPAGMPRPASRSTGAHTKNRPPFRAEQRAHGPGFNALLELLV